MPSSQHPARIVQLPQGIRGLVTKESTRRRQRRRVRAPINEFRADPSLQCANTPAEGWLGDMSLNRGPGEVASVGQSNEVLQPSNVHVPIIACLFRGYVPLQADPPDRH